MQTKTPVKWEEKTLGEIAQIKGGKRVPKGHKLQQEKTPYPYIRVTDFNDNGSVDLNNIFYVDESIYKQIKNYTISAQDLYISIAGTIGKTGIIPIELEGANLTENACKLVFNDNIYNKFVYYFTQSKSFTEQAFGNTRVTAMPKLALTRLSTISLLCPQIDEQERIVEILDKAFEDIDQIKENAKQNLQNAKDLFESYLNQLFTKNAENWEKKLLNQISVFKSGTTIDKRLEKEAGEVLYVKVGDMNLPDNEIEINTSSRFTDSQVINNGQIIPLGSIIFPKRGGAIATNKKRKIIKPTIVDLNTMAIKSNPELDDDLFYYWFQRINLADLSNGTTIPQINNYSFDELSINYPKSLIEQREIVKKLDDLQEETKQLEQIYQQKIEQAEELKQSILQKAFNGEL